MERTKHTWNVQLQAQNGEVINRKVKAFWDPKHTLTEQSVLDAGRIEAGRHEGREFVAISAKLVDYETVY